MRKEKERNPAHVVLKRDLSRDRTRMYPINRDRRRRSPATGPDCVIGPRSGEAIGYTHSKRERERERETIPRTPITILITVHANESTWPGNIAIGTRHGREADEARSLCTRGEMKPERFIHPPSAVPPRSRGALRRGSDRPHLFLY